MAHLAKYGRNSIARLSRHFERAKDVSGTYVKFNNININLSLTPLNYNLAPDRSDGQVAFINRRLSEVRCLARSDVNIMCSWVITVPKDLVGTDYEKRFFQETYGFLEEKYGKENVISAYVHKDETTPHIHFTFIPVVKDKKRGDFKVSAKECITQNDLKTFHNKLDEHLKKNILGYTGNIITGELKTRENKTITQLKESTQQINLIKKLDKLPVPFPYNHKDKYKGMVVVHEKNFEALKNKGIDYEKVKSDNHFLRGEVEQYKNDNKKLSEENSRNMELKKLIQADDGLCVLPKVPEHRSFFTQVRLKKEGCVYNDCLNRYVCSISIFEIAYRIIQDAIRAALDYATKKAAGIAKVVAEKISFEKNLEVIRAFTVCRGRELARVETHHELMCGNTISKSAFPTPASSRRDHGGMGF